MPRLTLFPKLPTDIQVEGLIFDMDGTLCLPQTWMFSEMRRVLGIARSVDILDHIYSLDVAEQEIAHEKKPQPGLEELMLVTIPTIVFDTAKSIPVPRSQQTP
ncbi:hypothetical protein LIPSTDRAFT_179866 [Lipomyces starkeyi NRRL Y-11557]|uniref:Uncharacterized protein n=1 Tax=Lipomyces starkeyi NRRL Y-11557 TaxID=675824 RepID=A0A1E3PWN9_LIPST|nr:hypothetical protein LIPSTDRAFT_179866 [Lipomyces starkeyi NRRL Y-11557]